MGRTAAMGAALLMVLLTASAGVVTPAAGGTGLADAGGSDVVDDPALDPPREGAVRAATTAMPPEPVENSTARLVIPDDELERSGMAAVQPDLGAALANGGDDLHHRHSHLVAEFRFDAATDEDERKVVIDQTLIDLKDEAVAMRERQHAAISSYANGTIDERELLRTLARIDRSARRMLETTSYLRANVDLDLIGLHDRIRGVEAILETLKGPVREEVRRTLSAGGETSHFYVEANETALVLSTVDDEGTFLREAYVPGNRGEGPSRKVEDPWHALQLSAEYYPWVRNNTLGNPDAGGLVHVHKTILPHVQGETIAYLDAYSGHVFYETQRLDIEAMPTSLAHNVTKDGLEIEVHRTYPGGPMLVGVYDAATGNPANAIVSVSGVEIGRTNADGFVRAVEPRTAYEIAVQTPRAATNVTVDPQADD